MCVSGLPTCHHQIRFRKPRFLGRAPSKDQSYFKKYYPTTKDLEKSLPYYDNYNIMLKSIVAAFQEELVSKESKVVVEESTWNEEAHHLTCMKYNEAENERMRHKRLQRLEEIKKSEKTDEVSHVHSDEDEKFKEEVLKTIEESKDWLTLDNMEEKIAEAVDNPINFNFGINLSGTITRRTALVLPPDHPVYQSGETKST